MIVLTFLLPLSEVVAFVCALLLASLKSTTLIDFRWSLSLLNRLCSRKDLRYTEIWVSSGISPARAFHRLYKRDRFEAPLCRRLLAPLQIAAMNVAVILVAFLPFPLFIGVLFFPRINFSGPFFFFFPLSLSLTLSVWCIDFNGLLAPLASSMNDKLNIAAFLLPFFPSLCMWIAVPEIYYCCRFISLSLAAPSCALVKIYEWCRLGYRQVLSP